MAARRPSGDLRRRRPGDVPAALARLHRELPVGANVSLWLPDRLPVPAADLLHGAGFAALDGAAGPAYEVERLRTLADRVGPGLRLLVCGLNASLYAADVGVPFARPGNRFWPAMVAAGVVPDSHQRRADLVFRLDRVGFTDLVKRATRAADEVTAAEYRDGGERLGRLVRWLRPRVVCFLGLTGYRQAFDPSAVAGPVPGGFAGGPAYLAPNPSGLNAHCQLPELAGHLRAALELGERGTAAGAGPARRRPTGRAPGHAPGRATGRAPGGTRPVR
ncbi:MAG: mismatch-specific DNA-glycosylase [Acidimicrobiales bacterium]